MSRDILEADNPARSTLGNFATKLATLPIAFAASVLVARALGPADRGLYAFLGQLGGFVLPLVSFGFPSGVVYFVSSGRYLARDVACTCLVVGLLLGALGGILTG